MEDLTSVIVRAQRRGENAYDILVRRFQNMAIAYAFAALGNIDEAEDAAQEAFVEAFLCLPRLREPLAFSSWLRCILWKRCDRILRHRQIEQVPLESVAETASGNDDASFLAEKQEMARQVRAAIASLPKSEKEAVLLFYMGCYSQQQIADFLEVPLSTVKKRLYTARQKLRQRMIETMPEELSSYLPKPNPLFGERVKNFTHQFSRMIDDGQSVVYSLFVLADKQNTDLSKALTQIREDVQEGATLSEAMSKYPLLFEPSTSQASGKASKTATCNRCSDNWERPESRKKQPPND